MDDPGRQALEASIREAWERGEMGEAARLGLATYMDELLRFQLSIAQNQADAQDAFQEFCLDLLQGLPAFRWEAPFRGWAYTLARHAAYRVTRRERRLQRRQRPLEEAPWLEGVLAQSRATTALFVRTEVKGEMGALRSRMDPVDRQLLALRLGAKAADRGRGAERAGLAWKEIAQILDDGDAPLEGAALRKAAAKHRQRYKRLKDALTLHALRAWRGLSWEDIARQRAGERALDDASRRREARACERRHARFVASLAPADTSAD